MGAIGRGMVGLGLAAMLALSGAPAMAAGSPKAPIIGVWQTADKSQVTIAVCPEDYCGTLTRVAPDPVAYAKMSAAEKKRADAQDPTEFLDTKNKDAKLRTRSLVGIRMFTVHASDKPDTFTGTLYNPGDGGTYDGSMRVESPTKLLLSGCMFKVLCKSQEWTRLK